MKQLLTILLSFSLLMMGCEEEVDTEITLWGEVYSVENTTELDLSTSGLTGSIPPEIGNLTNLTFLNLGGNELTGSIPPEIGNLTNLTYLDLRVNQLTGFIPPEIGYLTNLTYLELKNNQLEEIIAFADNNLKVVKFLPDNKNIFTRRLKFEYYDYLPILSLRDIPLDNSINYYLKRAFDIVFSLFVIVFVMSWLTPLVAILIRLESKGPIFFKQYRNGINSSEFPCYKFRSMAVNKDSDKKMATKGDMRITKVGASIRKTSIDELPQFFNVFFG
mgnify:CR=1 FL=1